MGLIQADIWEISGSYGEPHGCRVLGREKGDVDDDSVSSLDGH